MSIDLSQPAVPSQGNLDPFDCYVTYRLLTEGPKTGGHINALSILLLCLKWHHLQSSSRDQGKLGPQDLAGRT
jgi:hypothetical protein